MKEFDPEGAVRRQRHNYNRESIILKDQTMYGIWMA